MRRIAILAVLAAVFCTGCISTTARVHGCWGEPYIGTQLALGYAGMIPLLWVDLPLDVILDTACLPVDLVVMPFAENGYNH